LGQLVGHVRSPKASLQAVIVGNVGRSVNAHTHRWGTRRGCPARSSRTGAGPHAAAERLPHCFRSPQTVADFVRL